jgi:hypothetical protein
VLLVQKLANTDADVRSFFFPFIQRDLSAVSGALMEACVHSLRLALEYDEKKLEHLPVC